MRCCRGVRFGVTREQVQYVVTWHWRRALSSGSIVVRYDGRMAVWVVALISPLLTYCGVNIWYIWAGRVMIFGFLVVGVDGTHVGHLIGLMLGQRLGTKNDAPLSFTGIKTWASVASNTMKIDNEVVEDTSSSCGNAIVGNSMPSNWMTVLIAMSVRWIIILYQTTKENARKEPLIYVTNYCSSSRKVAISGTVQSAIYLCRLI